MLNNDCNITAGVQSDCTSKANYRKLPKLIRLSMNTQHASIGDCSLFVYVTVQIQIISCISAQNKGMVAMPKDFYSINQLWYQ